MSKAKKSNTTKPKRPLPKLIGNANPANYGSRIREQLHYKIAAELLAPTDDYTADNETGELAHSFAAMGLCKA